MDNVCQFKIKSPRWTKILFLGFLVLCALFAVVITVLYFAGVFKDFWNEAAPFYLIAIFPLPLVGFGLYAYKKEEFSLKDGVFTYVKVFRKAQSARVEQIDYVKITRPGLIKVEFVGKDGKTLISFFDDGTSFGANNVFLNSLFALNIPVKHL